MATSTITLNYITHYSSYDVINYTVGSAALTMFEVNWGTSTSYGNYYMTYDSTYLSVGTHNITISSSTVTSGSYTAGAKYYYYLYAIDSTGSSSSGGIGSPSSNATLYCNFAPTVSLSVTGQTASTITVKATFSNAEGVTIFRNSTTQVGTITYSGSTVVDSGLSAGTSYSYYGMAVNSINGETTNSSTVTGTTTPASVTPTITFDSLSTEYMKATLSYTATNADGVYIYISTTTTRPSSYTYYTSSSASFTASGLIPGTKYYFWVQAYTGNYSSPTTTSSVAGYKSATIPTKVSISTALSLSKSDEGVILNYGVDDGTYVYIYRGKNTTSLSEWTGTTNMSTYTDYDVVPGNTYYYRIKATDGTYYAYSPGSSTYSSITYTGTPSITFNSVAIGSSAITLNYTPDKYASQIKIYRSTSSSVTTSDLLITLDIYDSNDLYKLTGSDYNVSVYTDSDVEVGTTYYYRVQAVNSSYSSPLSSTLNATIPSAPSITSFTASPGDGQISLTWYGDAIDTIKVYRRAGSSGSYSRVTTLTGSEAIYDGMDRGDYLDTGLTNGTTYYYYIVASNGNTTTTTTSSIVSATPSATVYPTINSYQGTDTGSAIELEFACANATKVIIYKGLSTSSVSSLAEVSVSSNLASYTDSAVSRSTTYYYQFIVYSTTYGYGQNPYPSADTYYTITTSSGSSTDVPEVTSFSATGGDSNYVSLAYTVSNADTVYINRRPAGTNDPFIAVVTDNLTGYTDTGLVAGQTYEYFINAYDSTTKVMSDPYPASGYATATPGSGSGASVTSFTGSATDTSVILEYTVNNASYVEIARTCVTTGVVTLLYPESLTKYTDTDVTIGNTYTYYIRAIDSNGNSGTASSVYTVTIGGVAPAGSNLLASASGTTITLTYTLSDVDTVYIYRGTSSSNLYFAAQTYNTSTYVDSGLVANTTYYYRIVGYNSTAKTSTGFIPSADGYVSATTSGGSSVNQPTIGTLSLSSGSGYVTLSYAASNATSVFIEKTTSLYGTDSLSTIEVSNTSSYTDQNVTSGYTYYYRVRAYSTTTGTFSAYNSNGWVSTAMSTSSPQALSLNLQSNGSAIILSYVLSNADQCWIYRGVDGGEISLYASVTNTSSYTDSYVYSGHTYSYRIKAYNSTTGELSSFFPSSEAGYSIALDHESSRLDYNPFKIDRGTKEHSITFMDVQQTSSSEKNTWADWGLVPATRPLFDPPEPKYQYVDVPGTSGSLDFTEILEVGVTYNNREGSNEFYVLNGYGDWQSRYSAIMNYLQGRKRIAFLDDDPGYYYEGRFAVDEWRSDENWSRIVISYKLDPFKYERFSSVDVWQWDYLNFDTGVIRDYRYKDVSGSLSLFIPGTTKWIVPSFYVSPTSTTNSTSSYVAGTIESTFDWSNLATATYPDGFKYGYWEIASGADRSGTSSTLYYMSASKYQFNGYKSMVLTPPASRWAWICEYDSNQEWVGTYGQDSESTAGNAITVPIHENYYYTFTFASFTELNIHEDHYGNEISGGWEKGTINGNSGAFMESDYAIRSVYGFSFIGWETLYATPPSGCAIAIFEYDAEGNYLRYWGGKKDVTVGAWLNDANYYRFAIGISTAVTNQYSDGTFLATMGFSKWKNTSAPDVSLFTLGLSKSVSTDADASIYSADTTTNESLLIEVLALRCWNGMYGAGSTRKSNIEALGYDYDTVQARVNAMSEYFGYSKTSDYDFTTLNSNLVSAGYMTSGENFLTMTVPQKAAASTVATSRPSGSIDTSTTIAGLTVTIGTETYLLPRGSSQNTNIIIENQDTYLTFYGEGQVTVNYRGAIL